MNRVGYDGNDNSDACEPRRVPRVRNGSPMAVLFMGDLVVLARQPRLIEEANRRGYEAIAVVSRGTDMRRLARAARDRTHGLASLREVVQVPDARVSTVLPAVQPLLRRYDVNGVISVGEVFVEPVGILADCLGLPSAGTGASVISRNKLLQRTAVPELSPEWQVVGSGNGMPSAGFPMVVKPAGRFYSSGVREVTGEAELAAALGDYAPDEIVLAESRVVGQEFSVEALVQDGHVFWSGVTAKSTNEHTGPYFTEISHICPAPIGRDDASRLVAAHTEVLRRIGMRNGITHAEYRLTEDAVVLMEVAVRLPGDALMALWELATGVPLEPVMLDLALGLPASYPAPRRRARQYFVEHRHGTLRDVTADGVPVFWPARDDRWPRLTPLEADAPPVAHAVLVGRLPGDRLGEQIDSGQRSACVILDAPLSADLEPATQEAARKVNVIVDSA